MTDHAIELFLCIWRGLGICALCALSYGVLKRAAVRGFGQSLGIGAIFGSGAVAAMLSPALLQPGMLLDARGFLVGFAAGFGGWPAALAAVAISSVGRLAIGGAGTLVGLAGILIAAAMGLAWRRGREPGLIEDVPLVSLAGLGVMVSGHLSSFLLLPADGAITTALGLLAIAAPLYAIGAMTFGAMLSRERYLAMFGRIPTGGPPPPTASEGAEHVPAPSDASPPDAGSGSAPPSWRRARRSATPRLRRVDPGAWAEPPRLSRA